MGWKLDLVGFVVGRIFRRPFFLTIFLVVDDLNLLGLTFVINSGRRVVSIANLPFRVSVLACSVSGLSDWVETSLVLMDTGLDEKFGNSFVLGFSGSV